MAVIRDHLNRAQILHHLVTQNCLNPQTQGSAMKNGQWLAIHFIGKNGLRMLCQFHVNNLIKDLVLCFCKLRLDRLLATLVRRKYRIFCFRQGSTELQNLRLGYSPPFGNARPALDTVMLGDLRLLWQIAQVVERECRWIYHKAGHFKLPVQKVMLRQLPVFLALWWTPVDPEIRRNVGLLVALLRFLSVQERLSHRIYQNSERALHPPAVSQRLP